MLFGLSICYDRVLEVENELATAVCQDIETKGAVVPAQFRKGLFAIGALNNNNQALLPKVPSMVPPLVSFSLPLHVRWGICRTKSYLTLWTQRRGTCYQIFSQWPAVALKIDSVIVPEPSNTIEVIEDHLERAQTQENRWLEHAIQPMEKETLDEGDAFAWSAYHASQQEISDEPAISQRYSFPQLWTNSSDCHGCTTLCIGETHSVELASDSW